MMNLQQFEEAMVHARAREAYAYTKMTEAYHDYAPLQEKLIWAMRRLERSVEIRDDAYEALRLYRERLSDYECAIREMIRKGASALRRAKDFEEKGKPEAARYWRETAERYATEKTLREVPTDDSHYETAYAEYRAAAKLADEIRAACEMKKTLYDNARRVYENARTDYQEATARYNAAQLQAQAEITAPIKQVSEE